MTGSPNTETASDGATNADQRSGDDHQSPSPEQTYKTLVRVVAGGLGEALDRLVAISDQLDQLDDDPDPGPTLVKADPSVMAVVGWVSELPNLIRSFGDSTVRMGYPFIRGASVAWNTTAYFAEATGVAPFVAGVTEPTRTAIAEERERLTKVGTAEYARGRVLAAYAFEQSTNGIIGIVSESPQLADLVREQTIGIGGSAVDEVRDTGAAADSLTEGVIRRLLRRPVEKMPPLVVEQP